MFPFRPHSLLRHRWLAAVLALAVLVAQTTGLLHKLDFEAHPAGITCATCVAHGHADAPLPTAQIDIGSSRPLLTPFLHYSDALVQPTRHVARARGPPSLV